MVITLNGAARLLDTTTFTDLVPIEVTRITTLVTGQIEVEFASALTLRQQWLVRIRACTSPADAVIETMMISLLDSYTDLRTTRNSTGTLSSANLSAAVRALATAQIRMMRLMFHDTDGPAE